MATTADLQNLLEQIKKGLNVEELEKFNDLIAEVERSFVTYGGDPVAAIKSLQDAIKEAAEVDEAKEALFEIVSPEDVCIKNAAPAPLQ